MTGVLCLRLYGPMAGWGAPGARGGERPAMTRPNRSQIIGILASALGIPFGQEDRYAALASSVLVASATHGTARLTGEFRTAQEGARPPRKVKRWLTRADALDAGGGDPQIGTRQFVENGLWRAFVALRPGAAFSMEELRTAVEHPAFRVSLGRRECPLGLPLRPQVVNGGLMEALRDYPVVEDYAQRDTLAMFLDSLRRQVAKADENGFDLSWDAAFPGAPEDGPGQPVFARPINDDPASREAWRFKSRLEYRTRMRPAPQPSPESAALNSIFADADGE